MVYNNEIVHSIKNKKNDCHFYRADWYVDFTQLLTAVLLAPQCRDGTAENCTSILINDGQMDLVGMLKYLAGTLTPFGDQPANVLWVSVF